MAGTFYWVGQDGNVYVHQADGSATNYGKVLSAPSQAGVEAQRGSIQGTQIADPNVNYRNTANVTTAPSNPTGATAPAPKVLNQGAVDNTQGTIDQIPGLLEAALSAEGQKFHNTENAYNAQEQTQRGTYGTSTTTNQQNYDSNFMDSIRAGIKGLGGLMALLRGTGAAGGTAEDQVHDVVGGITADDIRGGKDTHDQNQSSLDSSLATFLTDLKGKRQLASDTYNDNQSAIRRDSSTQLQDLYSKMAGFYGDADQTAQRDAFMAKAGSLTPDIAANSRAHVSSYDTAPVVVHAPNLTAFAAPSQPDSATVPQDGQVGSGIFTIGRKKDQQDTTPVMVPQGA